MQWVEADGRASEVRLQLKDEVGLTYSWSYANDFTSAQFTEAYFGGPLLDFDQALSVGPEYVGGISTIFDYPARGELTMQFYGDGRHVLSKAFVSRKNNRKSFANRRIGLQHGIGSEAIRALGSAKLWQFYVTDSTGKIVAQRNIVPIDFGAVRRVLESQADAFEADLKDFKNRCSYDDGSPVL